MTIFGSYRAFTLWMFFALTACASDGTHEAMSGAASLVLGPVPDDVACIRIRAEGSRTVVATFDREQFVGDLIMGNLPLGTVVFTGEAFASCVTQPPASWTTEPISAQLSAGEISTVSLVFRRAGGRAAIEVTFIDDSVPAGITLISAPADAAQGAVVTDPEIIAIDDVPLAMPRPAVVTRTYLEPDCFLPVEGTRAIASTASEGILSPEPKSASITFRTRFDLPTEFTNPAITIAAVVDDLVEVMLNGIALGTLDSAFRNNCTDPPLSLEVADSGAFLPGENVLQFKLINANAPGLPLALSYKAQIRFE
jgi:hypothetical protein